MPTAEINIGGTTWLELLFVYLSGGGHLECVGERMFKRVNIRTALAEFKAAFRLVIACGLDADGASLFLPAQCKDFLLYRLGIKSRARHSCAHLCASTFIAKRQRQHCWDGASPQCQMHWHPLQAGCVQLQGGFLQHPHAPEMPS